jgi:uncharacterized protein (DUF342 family)
LDIVDIAKQAVLPPALTDLLRKAADLLAIADSRLEGSEAFSVERLLRSAIESEMDVARLRRMSLLLSEFERFHLSPSPRPQDAEVVIEDTPFEARLSVVPARSGGKSLTPADLRQRLKERGIVHGIREAALEAACRCASDCETVHRLAVAAGESAQDGEDGSVTFTVKAFDKRLLLDPQQPFFGDLSALVEDVKMGALVARIIPATPGRPGKDIRGNSLPSVPGLPVSLGIGEGLQLLGDGRELHALARGSLVVGEETLDLVPFHVVAGQLGVGQDIAFDGNVLVTGHVTGPVRIQARDIYVAGNAEGAQLSATGDVWVGGTIREKAAVDAEGRVFARAVSDASVRAIGDVYIAESIMESRVTSSGKVMTRPAEGVIEGGEICAYRGVTANVVGSSYGLSTKIKVGVEDLRAPLLSELDKRIRENEESLSKIDELKNRLSGGGRSSRDMGPDQQIVYISVLRKEIQSLEEVRSLRRRRKRLDVGKEEGAPPSLSVMGALHPPVSVEIGEASETLKERTEACVITLGPDRKLSIRKVDRMRTGTTARRRA